MENHITSKSTLPPPIQDLSPREIFLFTKIPIFKLDAFVSGRFKPNKSDRITLTLFGRRVRNWKDAGIEKSFVDREKYRKVQPFLSLTEKESLFNQPGKEGYSKKLDELIKKYWDQIVIAIAGE